MQTSLNLDQFRSAFLAGGLRSVSLQAAGGQFFITAEPQTGERITLATTHGKKLRPFRNPGMAIAILHEMGARKVEVDTSEWAPADAGLEGRKRPDTSERQRRAHQAAAHDAWFRRGVEMAIAESESPEATWDMQEDVARESTERRAAWLAPANGTGSSAVRIAAVDEAEAELAGAGHQEGL